MRTVNLDNVKTYIDVTVRSYLRDPSTCNYGAVLGALGLAQSLDLITSEEMADYIYKISRLEIHPDA